MTNPDYYDYPIEDVRRACENLVNSGCSFHQKWTCKHCSARQTMEEVNRLYASGHCEECNQVSPITHCNYLLLIGRGRTHINPEGK